jgi:hypothetical protein
VLVGSSARAARSSVEQASPHRGSGLGPAHGGGKVSGWAIAISGGKQRSVGAALMRENRERHVSIGINGLQKETAVRTVWRAYPLVMMEVAAQTGEAPRPGGGTVAQRFYLMNGDRHDDVWWPGGRHHPIGGPSGGVS